MNDIYTGSIPLKFKIKFVLDFVLIVVLSKI